MDDDKKENKSMEQVKLEGTQTVELVILKVNEEGHTHYANHKGYSEWYDGIKEELEQEAKKSYEDSGYIGRGVFYRVDTPIASAVERLMSEKSILVGGYKVRLTIPFIEDEKDTYVNSFGVAVLEMTPYWDKSIMLDHMEMEFAVCSPDIPSVKVLYKNCQMWHKKYYTEDKTYDNAFQELFNRIQKCLLNKI